MKLFHRKPQKDIFIKHPVHNNGYDDFVTNISELVYFPPFSIQKLEEKGITAPCKELNILTVASIKQIMYQLYQIPIVRQYFGRDFIHGFTAKIIDNIICYDNLDDTVEAVQFTREMTKVIERIFSAFLTKYHCYILYQGDSFEYISEDEMKHTKDASIEGHIIWIE